MKRPVTIPVEATIGTVNLRLFPYTEHSGGQPPDDWFDARPWAWCALVRVTFHFGPLVTTKRITQRWCYWGPRTWPTESRPSEAALAEGRQGVLLNLVERLRRHGLEVTVDDLVVEEVAAS